MNVGPWEIFMIILLLGLLILPLVIVIKLFKIEKRVGEIEDQMNSSQPEEDG